MRYLPRYQGPYTIADRRCDLGQGDFGAIAPYWCTEHNEPVWHEPETVCTQRQTRDEPGFYDYRCPVCGRIECCSENEENPKPYQAVKRYILHRHAELDQAA